MGKESDGKARPQLVKLDKAFKLAEAWVNNMHGSTDEVNEVEFESRPPRLGLGAKVTRHVEVAASNDPVERKLMGKLGVGKKRSYKGPDHADTTKTSKASEDLDDESDSRIFAFSQRKTTSPTAAVPQGKKRKGPKANAG